MAVVQLTGSSDISIHWGLVLHMAELVLGVVGTAALDARVTATTLTTHPSSCNHLPEVRIWNIIIIKRAY